MRRAAESWQIAFVLAAGGLALTATFNVLVEGLRRKALRHHAELCLAEWVKMMLARGSCMN